MVREKSPEQADLRVSPSFLRRLEGPKAKEIYLRVRPDPSEGDAVVPQTESIYRQLREILLLEGGSLEHVVRETVFFRNISVDMEDFTKARARVLHGMGHPNAYAPASTYVEQPPLDCNGLETIHNGSMAVEILVTAVVPHAHCSTVTWEIPAKPRCSCASCAEMGARALLVGGQKHVFAGNIYGTPGLPFDEALSMFEMAEQILQNEGMTFRSVPRTWIYLRDMERDYADLNRARRTFFERTGVLLHPASTGINGSPFPAEHNFVFGFYAIQAPQPVSMEIMTTPTLNEAPEYGSDFSRGMRVVDSNKVALYVSGTASVDEMGRTAHEDDFEAQVERMMLNVQVLLEKQGAGFRDLVSAITYIKRAADAPSFRRILRERGIGGFPNVIVEAGVCRPDLLCEIEAIAVLPRGQGGVNS